MKPKDSMEKAIKKLILDFLRDYGSAKKSNIVKHIWMSSGRSNLYFDHIPNVEVEMILSQLTKDNLLSYEEDTGLYQSNQTIQVLDVDKFNSNWHLRVMGNYLLKSSIILPIKEISEEFNRLDGFNSRIEDLFSLKCNWKKDGINSFLFLDDTSSFTIQVYFSTSVHPEIIVNDILLQSAKNELMKTALGTGFFIMHSACKKILTKTVNTDLAVISSFELLKNKER